VIPQLRSGEPGGSPEQLLSVVWYSSVRDFHRRMNLATANHSFQRARQREQGRVVHKEQLIKTEPIDIM